MDNLFYRKLVSKIINMVQPKVVKPKISVLL